VACFRRQQQDNKTDLQTVICNYGYRDTFGNLSVYVCVWGGGGVETDRIGGSHGGIKITALQHVSPWNLVVRRSRSPTSSHSYPEEGDSSLLRSSDNYQTTWRRFPEDTERSDECVA
jgi:hypothetical protein